MTQSQPVAGAEEDEMIRLEFDNGWIIDILDERDGEIYYQRWNPAGETDLRRMVASDFREEIELHPPQRGSDAEEDEMSKTTAEQLRNWRDYWASINANGTSAAMAELLALRARVVQLEEALCRISTACRKDTSLSPKDTLLDFVVGVVDAAMWGTP